MLSRKTIELAIDTMKYRMEHWTHDDWSIAVEDLFNSAIAELEAVLKELEAIKDDPEV